MHYKMMYAYMQGSFSKSQQGWLKRDGVSYTATAQGAGPVPSLAQLG